MGWEQLPPETPTWVTEVKDCPNCARLAAEVEKLNRHLEIMKDGRDEYYDRWQKSKAEVGKLRAEPELTLINLIDWVHSRIENEITHRPDMNIHKRTLTETWEQVLIHLYKCKKALGGGE